MPKTAFNLINFHGPGEKGKRLQIRPVVCNIQRLVYVLASAELLLTLRIQKYAWGFHFGVLLDRIVRNV